MNLQKNLNRAVQLGGFLVVIILKGEEGVKVNKTFTSISLNMQNNSKETT